MPCAILYVGLIQWVFVQRKASTTETFPYLVLDVGNYMDDLRMGQGQKYKNMYTGKELQTGEYWEASVSTGLEMYDFHARFYDPALGSPDGFRLRLQWFVPDPATERACVCTEQFHNPYLAMGNTPVNGIDPDGQLFFLAPVAAGILLPTVTITAAATISTAAIITATVAVAAASTAAVVLTTSSAASTAAMTAPTISPPDTYAWDSSTGEYKWINDVGGNEFDIFMEGTRLQDGSWTFDGRMDIRPAHLQKAVRMPNPEFGYYGNITLNGPGSASAANSIQAVNLSSIKPMAAGPVQVSSTAAKLKTGLTAFEASNAAKMGLLNYAGGAKVVPGWYMTGMRRVGQTGALLNIGSSAYMYDQGQITGAKLAYDAVWTRIGLYPNLYAQIIYWSGIAGQHYGPSTWGWDIWSTRPKPLYDHSYLKP